MFEVDFGIDLSPMGIRSKRDRSVFKSGLNQVREPITRFPQKSPSPMGKIGVHIC